MSEASSEYSNGLYVTQRTQSLVIDQILSDLESYVSNCHGVDLDRDKPGWHHNLNREDEHLLEVWRGLLKMKEDAEQVARERTWLREFYNDCKKWSREDTQASVLCEDQVLHLSEDVYVNEGLTCPECKEWSREFAATGKCTCTN